MKQSMKGELSKMDQEKIFDEIETLQFCLGEFINQLATLSVSYQAQEPDAQWKLAYETARLIDTISMLDSMIYTKLEELKTKKEPTSSTNEVRPIKL